VRSSESEPTRIHREERNERRARSVRRNSSVPILYSDDIVEVGGRRFQDVTIRDRLHPMDRLRENPESLSLLEPNLLQRFRRDACPKTHLPGKEKDRFVLHLVVLKRKRLAGVDMQDFPDVLCSLGPDQFMAPGLLDPVGKLFQDSVLPRSISQGWVWAIEPEPSMAPSALRNSVESPRAGQDLAPEFPHPASSTDHMEGEHEVLTLDFFKRSAKLAKPGPGLFFYQGGSLRAAPTVKP